MSNVYISFLGTTNYFPCHYSLGDFKTPEPVRFVQEASILHSCAKWKSQDRIIIFTTMDAEKKNWRDHGHYNKDKEVIPCEGLETRLKKLALKPSFQNIPVVPGHNQEEIWQQFNKVFDALHPNDNVVFDITHAFRSIPMLAIVVLQYARVFKSVSLKGIYYGAFEALEKPFDLPPEERNVLLVDLTPLAQLMNWTVATDRFLESGDTALMGELAQDSVAPILKDSRGKNVDAKAIKDLGGALKNLSWALSTCRGPEMSKVADWLKQTVIACSILDPLPPFKRLFNRIEERIKPFSGGYMADGLAAVRWCCEHTLIQQGFTLLEELLFSYVVLETGGDMQNITSREIASQSFMIISKKLIDNPTKWELPAGKNEDTTERMIEFILSKGDLYKKCDSIRTFRNDLNHAGYNDCAKSVSDAWRFADELKKLHTEVERILLHDPTVSSL